MHPSFMFIAVLALGCNSDPKCDTGDCDAESSDGSGSQSGNNGAAEDLADNDGDGFSNAEEIAAGTNPNYEYSRPYTGGYNVGFCETPPEPTGPTGVGINSNGVTWAAYQVGDVVENWTMTDQYGEEVDLYSFCGKTVMVSLSAGWCNPCRALAQGMQQTQNDYRDQGLQIIEIITQDNQRELPSIGFLMDWHEQYAFTDIPVLLPPRALNWDAVTVQWETDNSIPTVYIIGPDGTVLSADEGVHNPAPFLP